MRYTPQSANPRYLGGVDVFDVYITPVGNIIARYGDRPDKFFRLGKKPYRAGKAIKALKDKRDATQDAAERIDAMILCFAPDVCAE